MACRASSRFARYFLRYVRLFRNVRVMSAFGDALAAVLKHEGRNKEDVAQVAGVAPSTVYRLVKGEVRPDHDTLPRIINAATSSIDWRFELIVGHLIDEVMASGLPLSGLVLRRANGQELTEPPAIAAEAALLLDCAGRDPEVAEIVKDLAGVAVRAATRDVEAKHRSLYRIIDGEVKMVAENTPRPRKNAGAPAVRPSLPPKPKAS